MGLVAAVEPEKLVRTVGIIFQKLERPTQRRTKVVFFHIRRSGAVLQEHVIGEPQQRFESLEWHNMEWCQDQFVAVVGKDAVQRGWGAPGLYPEARRAGHGGGSLFRTVRHPDLTRAAVERQSAHQRLEVAAG